MKRYIFFMLFNLLRVAIVYIFSCAKEKCRCIFDWIHVIGRKKQRTQHLEYSILYIIILFSLCAVFSKVILLRITLIELIYRFPFVFFQLIVNWFWLLRKWQRIQYTWMWSKRKMLFRNATYIQMKKKN